MLEKKLDEIEQTIYNNQISKNNDSSSTYFTKEHQERGMNTNKENTEQRKMWEKPDRIRTESWNRSQHRNYRSKKKNMMSFDDYDYYFD
jgi:hypothetical protein